MCEEIGIAREAASAHPLCMELYMCVQEFGMRSSADRCQALLGELLHRSCYGTRIGDIALLGHHLIRNCTAAQR